MTVEGRAAQVGFASIQPPGDTSVLTMRHGARQNAISNSPIVRALLKPVHVELPQKTSATPTPPPPAAVHLISTQPRPSPPPAAASGSPAAGKRKREELDEGDERDPPVEVSYNAQNLPDELRKCTPTYRRRSGWGSGSTD